MYLAILPNGATQSDAIRLFGVNVTYHGFGLCSILDHELPPSFPGFNPDTDEPTLYRGCEIHNKRRSERLLRILNDTQHRTRRTFGTANYRLSKPNDYDRACIMARAYNRQ